MNKLSANTIESLSKAYRVLVDIYILLVEFFQELPYCEDVIRCGTSFAEAALVLT
jgi:hypothetical protein